MQNIGIQNSGDRIQNRHSINRDFRTAGAPGGLIEWAVLEVYPLNRNNGQAANSACHLPLASANG